MHYITIKLIILIKLKFIKYIKFNIIKLCCVNNSDSVSDDLKDAVMSAEFFISLIGTIDRL